MGQTRLDVCFRSNRGTLVYGVGSCGLLIFICVVIVTKYTFININ